ncbi:MAG: substrate-binding domain-containing protein [Oscillospiraceae bacterium]|jgi:hypothetical protein|nr:substrate-binding domain-containing protein [Oscillospiraceae bacterium]
MRRFTATIAIILILFVLPSCSDNSKINDTLLSLKIADISQEDFPKISSTKFGYIFLNNIMISYYGQYEFNYSEAKSAEILTADVKSGDIDIAIIEKPNKDFTAEEELEYFLIGTDATIFLTSVDNPVDSLKIEQLNEIYCVKSVTNWNQVGGEDGKIWLPEYSDKTDEGRLRNLFLNFDGDLFNVTQEDLLNNINFSSPSLSAYSLNNDFSLLCTGGCNYSLGAANGTSDVKAIIIDGKKPTQRNILSGQYPYLTYTYAVVKKTNAQKPNIENMINWLMYSDEADKLKIVSGIGITDTSPKIDFDKLQ